MRIRTKNESEKIARNARRKRRSETNIKSMVVVMTTPMTMLTSVVQVRENTAAVPGLASKCTAARRARAHRPHDSREAMARRNATARRDLEVIVVRNSHRMAAKNSPGTESKNMAVELETTVVSRLLDMVLTHIALVGMVVRRNLAMVVDVVKTRIQDMAIRGMTTLPETSLSKTLPDTVLILTGPVVTVVEMDQSMAVNAPSSLMALKVYLVALGMNLRAMASLRTMAVVARMKMKMSTVVEGGKSRVDMVVLVGAMGRRGTNAGTRVSSALCGAMRTRSGR